MTRKPLIAFAVAAWSFAGAALSAGVAQEPVVSRTAQADRRFQQLDRNRDGFLSRDEALEAHELDARFSELDANNDGKLSRDEYRVVDAGEAQALPGAASAASGSAPSR
jgi:hypothetical protein